MELQFYKNQSEKEVSFNHSKIDTRDGLYSLLDMYNKYNALKEESNNLVFRGMNNASYKLYSSAQRNNLVYHKLSNTDYHSDVNLSIQRAKGKSNHLLETYFKQIGNGKTVYDLSILSFLQHYGTPTPIIDWTHSFLSALYFAIDGHKPLNDIEFGNDISIYVIDSTFQNGSNELINTSRYFKNAQSELEYAKSRALSLYLKAMIDSSKADKVVYELPYLESINSIRICFMSDWLNSELPLYINNNLNIIAQQGAFIYNNSEYEPLEELFKGGSENIPFNDSKTVALDDRNADGSRIDTSGLEVDPQELYDDGVEWHYLQKIKCIDIDSSLINEIKVILKQNNINEDTVYPLGRKWK